MTFLICYGAVIHIDFLLDRQPVGSVLETASETTDDQPRKLPSFPLSISEEATDGQSSIS